MTRPAERSGTSVLSDKVKGLIHVLLYTIRSPPIFRVMESHNLLYVVKSTGVSFGKNSPECIISISLK
jgi:hypothetical protein